MEIELLENIHSVLRAIFIMLIWVAIGVWRK